MSCTSVFACKMAMISYFWIVFVIFITVEPFDPSLLFDGKKSTIIDRLKKDLGEYKGIKFSVGLSLEFFKDEKDGTRKHFQCQRHGEQSAILDETNANKYYN